jgi:hypothetical protein
MENPEKLKTLGTQGTGQIKVIENRNVYLSCAF